MICGAWLPSPLWEREPVWDPKSEIRLAGLTVRPDKNTYEAKEASKPPTGPPPPSPPHVETKVARDFGVKSRDFGVKRRDWTGNW